MRILGTFCFFIGFVFWACGSKETATNTLDTEGGAKAVFSKQFPLAQDVIWDSIEIGVVASFLKDSQYCKAFYNKSGIFQYTTTVLEMTEMPKNIQDFISKKYKSADIAIIQEINDGKNKTYQIELSANTDYVALEFDGKGNLIKEIKTPLSNEEIQQQEEEGVDENEK